MSVLSVLSDFYKLKQVFFSVVAILDADEVSGELIQDTLFID